MDGRKGINLGPGVWLREQVREMTIVADQYDFAVTLLLLPNEYEPAWQDDGRLLQDTYERFQQAARSGPLGEPRPVFTVRLLRTPCLVCNPGTNEQTTVSS